MKSIGMVGILGLGYALGAPGVAPSMPKSVSAPLTAFHQDVNRAIGEFSGHSAKVAAMASVAGNNTMNGLSQVKSAKDLEQARQQSVDMIQNKAAAVLIIVPRVP